MKKDMKFILNKFDYCDMFSLSSAMQISKIPIVDKERLLSDNLNDEKKYLSDYYNHFAKTEKVTPDFETMFNDILKECEEFYGKIRGKDLDELCDGEESPFICDHVGEDTKYFEPLGLIWHFYHNIQQALMDKDYLSGLQEIDKFKTDQVISKEEDKVLIDNFIKYEYTFSTHCTKGPLQLVLYFKLNDQTKEWLLNFSDDFALCESDFEDLAIYSGEKLEFSSCTHEEFNSLENE